MCSGDAEFTVVPPHVAAAVHGVSMPVRRTTSTCSTVLASPAEMASSTAAFSDTALPRRYCPSVVITSLASASSIRAFSAAAEYPAKTTECSAPSRAHASIATMASGTIGM